MGIGSLPKAYIPNMFPHIISDNSTEGVNFMDEKWLPIKNYEGLYEISSLGRIRHLPRTWINNKGYVCNSNMKILKPLQRPNGYLFIRLSKNNHSQSFNIHRLVALTFLPNENSDNLYVNHKDLNKQNNNIENLEWCTPQNNNIHYFKTSQKTKKVICKELNLIFDSGVEANKYFLDKYGIKINVNRSCNSKHLKAGKYKWEYYQ